MLRAMKKSIDNTGCERGEDDFHSQRTGVQRTRNRGIHQHLGRFGSDDDQLQQQKDYRFPVKPGMLSVYVFFVYL